MSVATSLRAREDKRLRTMITPEGIALPIKLASRATRLAALVLDLLIMIVTLVAVQILLASLGVGVMLGGDMQNADPVMELLQVLMVIFIFLLFNGYFMYFELGPRGATPGKRMMGIRIAARDGGRLTAEAVIARNLLRDIELFLPLGLSIAWFGSAVSGQGSGWTAFAAMVWFLIFAFFPFFNRERLRAGDIVAGTWVVELPKQKLQQVMSAGEAAHGRSVATGAEYRFGESELSVYGEYELQTLERVLREANDEAIVSVAQTICGKIGWESGAGDERAFLEAFYAQLRARLERNMRFGKRKADKYS